MYTVVARYMYIHVFVGYAVGSCMAHVGLVNQTTPTAALDVLHVLVMQYIQRCNGSGLVYETRHVYG